MATLTQKNIFIFPQTQDLFQFAANDFMNRAKHAVQEKGFFSVVLSGGNTPKSFFDMIVESQFIKNNIPWGKILFFFGDERYVPLNDEKSNYHTAYEHLFSKVPINPDYIYPIKTDYSDPQKAATAYEKTLRTVFNIKNNEFPCFDLIYLGLGDNAHTASLMPLSNVVLNHIHHTLPKNQLVASIFVPELNMDRITLTANAINHANNIIFLVTGSSKSTAIKEVLKGPYAPETYPAQLIHCIKGNTLWYLDQSAAIELKPVSF